MKLISLIMKLFFWEKFHCDLYVQKIGGLESLNFDLWAVNFDTMKLIFCVKIAEPRIPQWFFGIEKERKLQYHGIITIVLIWSEWRDSNSRHPRLRRLLRCPKSSFARSVADDFDRYAISYSLNLPLAAVVFDAQSRQAPYVFRMSEVQVFITKIKRAIPKRYYSFYGRSEETRTPGILLPKQARYQLRYTPIHNDNIIQIYYLNVNT